MALSHDLCTILFPPSLPLAGWLPCSSTVATEEDDLGDSISEPFKATSAPRTALLMVSQLSSAAPKTRSRTTETELQSPKQELTKSREKD